MSRLDEIRKRSSAWLALRGKAPRRPANANQAAVDRAYLLEEIGRLLEDSGMACEEPCGTCAGCLYAEERLGGLIAPGTEAT